MSTAKQRISKVAEEMESTLADREEARIESERARLKDVMQGMQDPGAHETVRRGIKWGPSYRTRRKRTKAKQDSNKDSGSKD